tara:strand:- start:190 stop:2352 length:2163 start_codon:yes stop_codon:yes gene_type:complete
MAETIISPGVFQRENDISFIQPASVEAGAAFVGPTVKGPVEVPTTITSYGEYVRKFGETFESGSTKQEYLTSLAVKSYFQQGGNTALITRVVSGSSNWTAASNTTITNTTVSTGANTATGSGTLVAAFVDGQEARINYDGEDYRFIGSGNPIPLDDTDGNVYFFSTGSDATGTAANLVLEINGATALQSIVSASSAGALLQLTGSSAGTDFNGLTFQTGSSTGTFDTASVADLITLEGGTNTTTQTSNPFAIQTLGRGEIFNNSTGASDAGSQNSDSSLVSGSVDNLRYEISNVSLTKGTFSLTVRRGDDNLKNKIVLETFNNLSLDPNTDNYVAKVIGDQNITKQSDTDGNVYIDVDGEYPNKSNYIRVSAVNTPTLNYLGTDGLTVGTDSSNVSYSASLPIAQSGSFHGAVGSNVQAGGLFYKDISGASLGNSQGLVDADYTDVITILENKDEYQFNMITVPGLTQQAFGSTISKVVSLAETRGDAIAVVDPVGYNDTLSNAVSEADEINSSYAASYWPWVQVGTATGKNQFVPPSVVIPGVYAFTDGSSAPWFAPAGLVRGGIPNVIQAERKLTKADRDTLYDGNVNPIATFPGQGIAAFGQKTLQKKSSALDRINVRRLLIQLKKFFGDQARNLVFEQNTIATRNRFLSIVNPYLETVVQQQGLFSFRVVMDDTNNTNDVIDRNQLVGQVFIQPAKTAEFIVLDFTIEPTGATFDA